MSKKLLISLAVLGLTMVAMPLNSLAAEKDQDGIHMTILSDKETYQAGEKPEIRISLTNGNSYAVDNVNLESALPEGFNFEDEKEAVQKIGTLQPEQTKEVTFSIVADTVQDIESEEDKEESHSSDLEKQEDSTNKKNQENKTVKEEIKEKVATGDHSNMGLYVGLLAICCVIIIVVLIRKKRTNRFLAVLLCIGVGSTVFRGMIVEAVGEVAHRQMFLSVFLTYNNEEYEIATELSYEKQISSVSKVDSNAEKFADIIFDKKGRETVSIEAEDKTLPVTEVSVDYVLKEGTGIVTVENITRSSYLSTAAGAASAPIDINVYEDAIENAVITFSYDESRLGDIDENDLKIAWYDEENAQVVLLDESVVNVEENTISVSTNHFSQYIVIDSNEWYEKWSIEQLVIRDSEGTETPYYNVIFALDGSGSMQGDKEQLCEEATLAFIRQLKENDKISVMSFDDTANVYIENTTLSDVSMQEIEDKVREIRSNGSTNYEEGLNTALSLIVAGREAEDVEETKSRQSLLIFLSDGEPTSECSEKTLSQLRYLAETAGCRAVAIGLGDRVDARYLEEIATAGQGEYFYVNDVSQLEQVFNTINGWYVGATVDTDGDGIPDIVETTGMRSQFGEFFRTDPHNPDTDGDGISDGVEMGTFIYRENGGSYFEISSSPTIPTNQSDQSKLVVEKIEVRLVSPDNGTINKLSFEELYGLFEKYQAVLVGEARLLDIAPDNLSETRYQDAQPVVDFHFHAECANPSTIHKELDPVKVGKKFSCVATTKCQDNVLDCGEDHNDVTFTVNNNNGTVETNGAEKVSMNVKEVWKEVLEEKISNLKSEFNNVRNKMTEQTTTFFNQAQMAKQNAESKVITKIEEKVKNCLGIPATVPDDIRNGFLQCFYDYISEDLVTNIKSYKNVKTSADLVNKVFDEVKTSNKTLEFKTPRNIPCSFTYNAIGAWGATYFSGTLTNMKTNESYTIGGTQIESEKIQSEMKYLKEFADTKIEEAKKAVIDDMENLLQVKKLKSFLKGAIKDKVFDTFSDYSPMLSKKAEKLYDQTEKFEELVNEYKKIVDIDFSDTDYDELTKKIVKYTESVDKWYDIVTEF